MPLDLPPAHRAVILVVALLIVGCASVESSTPTMEAPSSRPAPSATEALSQADLNGTRVNIGMATRRAEVRTATAVTATARESRRATQTAQVPVTQTAAAVYLPTNQSIAVTITHIPEVEVAWPMSPLSDSQLAEARACDIERLYQQRYDDLSDADMPGPHPLNTACDWAALAGAYAVRAPVNDESLELPKMAYYAYYMAVSQNPAFRLKNWLVFGYFGSALDVEAPPVAKQPVRQAVLSYSFGGIGYEAHAGITIDNAGTDAAIAIGNFSETSEFGEENTPTPYTIERDITGTIDSELVQALGASLTDLVPVDAPFDALACYDYYPFWSIKLTYVDGSQLTLSTLGNMLAGGGPWHVEIEGQHYIQYGYDIPVALSQIIDKLEIPGGVTAAMSCGNLFHEMLEVAFPDR